MDQSLSTGVTPDDALSTLLTTESLLFAVFGLVVSLTSSIGRARKWILRPTVIGDIVVALIALVAFGAAVAWHDSYVAGGFPRDGSQRIMALTVVAAVVAQPILAFLLTVGLRIRK